MIPYFQENDYFGGVNVAVDVIIGRLSGEFDADAAGKEAFLSPGNRVASRDCAHTAPLFRKEEISTLTVTGITEEAVGRSFSSIRRRRWFQFWWRLRRRRFGGGFSGGGGGRFGGGGAGGSCDMEKLITVLAYCQR